MSMSTETQKKIEGFRQILKSGYYADSRQVTETYNEVFHTRLTPTSCGTCIRQRMTALVAALDNFLKKLAEADEANNKNEEDHGTDGHTQSPSPTAKAKRKGKSA